MNRVPLTQQNGKVLVIHDQDAPAAKSQGKTWIHFIRYPDGRVLKEYSPPSPPPGSGTHTYRYVLVDLEKARSLTEENIQEIPVGEEVDSFQQEYTNKKGGYTRMAAPKKYHITRKAVMGWAESELESVGRIAAVEDPDIQYSYALSTVNGMAHLKDAIYELVQETSEKEHKRDLLRLHDQVIRVMNLLIKDYKINLQPIRNFNVRGVLSNLSYLKKSKKTRKNNKNHRNKTRKN